MCVSVKMKLKETKIKVLPARGCHFGNIHCTPFLKQHDEFSEQETCNSKITNVEVCLEGLGT